MKLCNILLFQLVATLSPPVSHHGNLSQEVLNILKHYTQKQSSAHASPRTVGHWMESEDQYGTVITTKDIELKQFREWVSMSFGKVQRAGHDGENPQWVIPAKEAGAAIYFLEHQKSMRIVVLKPVHW